MFRTPLTALVACLAIAYSASAQERLTLNDATTRALTKNHSIKIEREQVAASEARALGANGEYDRQLRFDVAMRHGRDPVTSIFSGAPAGSVAPTHSNFESGVSLSQLFKTGAVATVSTSVARDGSDSAFILFDPAYTTSLGVDLRQPLLRNRAIDPARAALRVTALDRDRSSAGLARQVLQTVSQVEVAYWQLVAARRDLEVHRGNVALAEHQREETQVRVKGGTVPGSDLAQPTAEVERRRGELLLAQEGVARAERTLKQLMIDSTADPMWDVEIVPIDPPDMPAMSITAAGAIADAQKNRPELSELAAAIAQTDVQASLATDAMKPRLDLVAATPSAGWQDRRARGRCRSAACRRPCLHRSRAASARRGARSGSTTFTTWPWASASRCRSAIALPGAIWASRRRTAGARRPSWRRCRIASPWKCETR